MVTKLIKEEVRGGFLGEGVVVIVVFLMWSSRKLPLDITTEN